MDTGLVPIVPAGSVVPMQAVNLAELVPSIELARSLFDDGDYQAALSIAAGIYDQAKAAAGYGEKFKRERQLIAKARRMQAEGLRIESICLCAMADAVDAAQAEGMLQRGRPTEKVQGSDHFTLDDIGIDKRRLSEARKIRDAERAEPGFIDRVVESRLSEGLEPTRANLRAAVGTASATKEERGDQLYETPDPGTKTLLALEAFTSTVDERACGKGAIMRILEDAGYDVRISDLRDRGTVTRDGVYQDVGDFLLSVGGAGESPDIVTNPPYGDLANKFAAHALREHKPRKLALLLNANFMFGFDDPDRRFVMDENPPSRIYGFTRRLPMMHRDGWEGNEASSRMNTAWFVWERNADGSYGQGAPQFIRVDWEIWAEKPPLPPEAGNLDFADIEFQAAADAGDDDDFTRETPFKSLEQRVDEDFARALVWAAEQETFDAVTLRRGIDRRMSTAEALIEKFLADGLIEPAEGGFRVSEKGWLGLEATAGVVLGMQALRLVEGGAA